jgi:glutamate N-acetyltransferase/amino-acid N-acetyltransferase
MTTRVGGFRFSAAAAGIKKPGRLDVGLAVADAPAVAAGVFTRNLVRAAPVVVAARRVRSGFAQAILANSGCANACTGSAGLGAALSTTETVAHVLGIASELILPASTGVIGALLPAARINPHATELARSLSPDKGDDFAQAILTTDRWPKVESVTVGPATLVGIAKGAGMIHPDVGLLSLSEPLMTSRPPHATLLVFLFTDLRVPRPELEVALVAATDKTFNACTVDGDTSTNDTVLALASGVSRHQASMGELTEALEAVCGKLARSMVLDGEGAEHAVDVRVRGLPTAQAARQVAQTVATSLLVKTALHGRDANWGRLLAAAGRAGVDFRPEKASISIAGVEIVRAGVSLGSGAEARAAQEMASPTYAVELVLGTGPGEFTYITSDLGHGYVDVNASYRS